ncbi:MAG TPA: efflux transporter periplasmic adaptor subunit, partial [Hyphomicrobiaceae bacterium]
MAKRIIIFSVVAIIVAAFLGGLSYFQFVLKPQMIRQFLSQMTPPPATVTAEAAKTEKWIEHLTSIGTMIASQGVDINTQVAGVVTEVSIESGQDVQEGATLV